MNTPAALRTHDLSVRFGGVNALRSVDLDCGSGQLTGLIGPNGAGKTTFIDAVTGFLPKNCTGRVAVDDDDISGLTPHVVAHRGLRRTWQTLELFDDISVRANLDVAARQLTVSGAVRDFFRPTIRDDRIEQALDLLELRSVADRPPRELSNGQRKLVGVARALVADARMLLLDEPAAGLDQHETRWLGTQLRRVVDEGYSVLLVDHDMNLVLSVCDRIHVLVFGELVATGTPEEVRNNQAVAEAYLGRKGRSDT